MYEPAWHDEPVTADDATVTPLAFSGQRLAWSDLPVPVRTRIVALAGAPVTAERIATSGFSPGFAAVLELADGRDVFVKAVSPEQNPDSPDLARAEIRVAACLPPQAPTAPLLWSDDDGDWVLLGFAVAHGRPPDLPWRTGELRMVLDTLATVAACEPVRADCLPRAEDALAQDFTGWQRLRAHTAAQLRVLAAAHPEHGAWVLDQLDALVVQEVRALDAVHGSALVHGDLRADNVLIDHDHDRVTFVDWPHASVGAPWLDLAGLLPSVAMQGGGDPARIFREHPLGAVVPQDELRSVVAGFAGYFAHASLQPAPPGIPNLPAFQRAQASTALRWLRTLG